MNKTTATKIAKIITLKQLGQMFENAREEIKDWHEASNVNKNITKGSAWNIIYFAYNKNAVHNQIALRNMIWEFGDYLDKDLIPTPTRKEKTKVILTHQDPIF